MPELLVIVLLICLLIYFIVDNRKKNKQIANLKAANDDAAEHNSVALGDLPIFYMLEELVKDDEGEVVDTIFRKVNKAFTLYYFKPEECYGKRCSEIFPDVLPVFLKCANDAIKKGKYGMFQFYRQDQQLYYSTVVNPTPDGKYVEVFSMDSSDIQKMSQKSLRDMGIKLSMVIDVLKVLTWRLDVKTRTVVFDLARKVSSSMAEFEETAITFSIDDLYKRVNPEDLDRVKALINSFIDGSCLEGAVEFRFQFRAFNDGRKEWVRLKGAVEKYDTDGKPWIYIGASWNITANKEMNQELIAAKERAERSDKLKSAFLANVSHEIRTPLNAIVGFSQLMVDSNDNEEKKMFSNYIETNSELLLQIINDILNLSKVEADMVDFVYTDFDLNALMKELEESLHLKLFADRSVVLVRNSGDDVFMIHSDRNRLSQVIINFLTNAIKYTQEGSITFGYEERDGGKLYFYVTDTGCGIAKENLQNVFERFVKLNSFVQGTGLGLSICKMIVDRMNGEIGVDSEEGKGSTFWFTIPLEKK